MGARAALRGSDPCSAVSRDSTSAIRPSGSTSRRAPDGTAAAAGPAEGDGDVRADRLDGGRHSGAGLDVGRDHVTDDRCPSVGLHDRVTGH